MTLEVSNIVCPTCGSPDHMHHLVGANVGYWDMKCFNCNSYFNFGELYKHRKVIKPKTNADLFRSKTDEELAEWLAEHDAGLIANVLNNDYVVPTKDSWLEWLKEENETN